jgi:hypothetical protein
MFNLCFWLNLSRFLNDHLSREGLVPENWIPKKRDPILSLNPGLSPLEFDIPQLEVDNQALENKSTESLTILQDDNVEDKADRKLNLLVSNSLNFFNYGHSCFVHAESLQPVPKLNFFVFNV